MALIHKTNNSPVKMVRYKDWTEKAAKVQRKKLWRTIARDHFKRLQQGKLSTNEG